MTIKTLPAPEPCHFEPGGPWEALVTGEIKALGFTPHSPPPAAVFPGAFNPLHHGHLEIAALAEGALECPIGFELSVRNVDKPTINALEVQRRLGQFPQDCELWLTAAPTFAEKAALFPGATFIVGADTMVRIADTRYYRSGRERSEALGALEAHGCRFLVFGRYDEVSRRFLALDDLDLPERLRALAAAVPESRFRRDISSTALRGRDGGN